MTCYVCRRPTTEGTHGACIERMQAVIDKLKTILINHGATTDEELRILRERP